MELAARRFGSPSSPPALLIHGASDSSSTWARLGPWLAERGFDVIAVDLRGHGDSSDDGIRDDDPLAQAANDLIDTLDTLRPDEGGVDLLLAHSLGTAVALTCIAHHPSFARRLVLEEPPGASMPFTALQAPIAGAIRAARADPAGLGEMLQGHGLSGPEVEARVKALAAADIDYLSILIGALDKLDPVRLAAFCTVPTLLLLGRDLGEPLSTPDGEQLAEYSHLSGTDRTAFLSGMPLATVIELDGGHDLHQPLFDSYTAALVDWLKAY